MKFDDKFSKRAAMARRPRLSSDVWSKAATDMVRIALFAGFEAKQLIVDCLRSSRGKKVGIRTVEKILTKMWGEERIR